MKQNKRAFLFRSVNFQRLACLKEIFTQVVFYPWGVLSTSQIMWLFKDVAETGRQTDGQTYIFSRLKISELGENSFILILQIVEVWSSHVKIRV